MIIKEIRCDVCNDLLVDSEKCFVYKSFIKNKIISEKVSYL